MVAIEFDLAYFLAWHHFRKGQRVAADNHVLALIRQPTAKSIAVY